MSVVLKYTHAVDGPRTGTIEVQPATTAKYVARRIAEAARVFLDRPWVLIQVDAPFRVGKRFEATVIEDDTIAVELDPNGYYSFTTLPSEEEL